MDKTNMRRQANAERSSKRALEGYSGWDNYETWCVHLWLDNEEALQADARHLARSGRTVYESAERLKEYVTEELLPDLGASFAADLLGAAMSEVNWVEIAESFREES